MALSDLVVFQEYARLSYTEVLAQQVELFNGASENTLSLAVEAHAGDFADKVSFALLTNLVKRRNPYGTGAQTVKPFINRVDTMVKVAGGMVPVDFQPSQFNWIQQNAAVAGAALGQQLAKQMLADMLHVATMSLVGAISNRGATVTYDNGGTFAAQKKLAFLDLNAGQGKFGDAMSDIRAWLIHSTPMVSLFANALTNNEKLFLYGSVNVSRDPFGRVFIMTDEPALKISAGNGTSTPDVYGTLGLTAGACEILQQDDFTDNFDTRNGDENIARTYQAEWSYMVGLKGYTWDKTNGGKAPTNAALATGTNWDISSSQDKTTAGVLIKSNG